MTQLATRSGPANASVQQFLEGCDAVKIIREIGDRFEFDFDPAIEVTYCPKSLQIDWNANADGHVWKNIEQLTTEWCGSKCHTR